MLDSARAAVPFFSTVNGQFLGELSHQLHRLGGVLGMAFSAGTLYVSDPFSSSVAVVEPQTPAVQARFGTRGTGPGQFGGVTSLAVDTAGQIHALDSGNSRVNVYNATGAFLSSYGEGILSHPVGLAISPSGHRLVLEGSAGLLLIFEPESPSPQVVALVDSQGQRVQPRGISVDNTGAVNLWVNPIPANVVI